MLAEKADNSEGSGDDVIFLPYGNAMRLNGTGSVDLYLFNSTSKEGSTTAKGIIENRLFQTYQDDNAYFVMSSAEMMDAMNTMMSTMMIVLVAIAAIIQVSRIGSMDYASAGSGYEMDAIAAVIVGGTSMSGGKGSIVGTVLGMLIIGVMNNLLTLFGVPPFLREACKGVIVIVAVLLQKKEADA